MKNLICAIALFTCIASQASGQITYGLRIATSPSVDPGTSTMIANRGLASESLVNISDVNYSEQFGLMGRYDMERFWFMTELMYGQSKTLV
jgi:hypothetical protein